MPAHAIKEKFVVPKVLPRLIPSLKKKAKLERPGWIPSHITENWDTDPFAYQTEKELMPAGGLHGQFLTYVTEVLRAPLQKQGLMLLVDTFLLYRNASNVKNRIGPDLLLMEDCFPAPSAYDLDIRKSPRCVFEITSPDSHFKDLKTNVGFYFGLGIETYMVIDAVTPQKKLREPIELHLWRKPKGQAIQKVTADSSGYFLLPEMNIKIAVQQQRLVFIDVLINEVLRDNGQLYDALEDAEYNLNVAEQRAEVAFSEGEQNKAIETARAMLANGLDVDIVMKCTGLSALELADL